MIALGFGFLTFLAMEFVAWATHKFVMHGFLWSLHYDHHNKDASSFFEKNDAFFAFFAMPSIVFLFLATVYGWNTWMAGLGLGIAAYGLCYFLVHDVFIHRRFSWFNKIDNPYFRALRKTHRRHHKTLGKVDAECFGMLWVPRRYWKDIQ